ncbi:MULTISPECIES: iron-siderophore ABC transporter substrate-binding protein [unclassified Thermoactinomyces]|uniref:ABC transporter substrate-binding protein n=1 Tax=unclassified Thermoactinomyces TaxID=2634588 RepID=UPI0018DAFD23|nr:iron-siderophore ABC transporter substrate-binding protein [Thermoactinomyces sp. CICC 10523]MBH8604954.1 iron-siderophore ABC transporter substrate-binding protein [Thermoactinomyces sp. CICC 10522]
MRSIKAILPPFLALALFSLVLAGCSSSDSSDQTKESGRTIQHAMGQSIVPTHPKRVVVLTNEGLEACLALGVKPVGAVKGFTGHPWYPHLAKELTGVTVVGTESQPDLETIASLKPDLIIGNKMRQEKVYEQLSAIAPTVFAETLRGDWKVNFSLYAKALNKEKEGNKVLKEYEQKVAEVRKNAGDLLNQKVSMVRFLSGETRLYQLDSFSGVILKDVGFQRPPLQNKNSFAVTITKEQIPQADGDIIFYFTYDTGDKKGNKQEETFLSDPLWANLQAVKKHRAFKVDDVIWNTAGGVKAAFLMLDQLNSYISKIKAQTT